MTNDTPLSDVTQKRLKSNVDTVEELFGLLNIMGNDRDLADAIVNHLEREHRTLQQGFWRLVKLTAYKYQDFEYDARNEASVKLASHISIMNEGLPYI